MAQEPVVIPEKIYFKIGEVCELLDIQAHVLRYWETEFSVLSPQKNKSGQRSYRRRDVEIALRIKQLLYSEMFTIAGARKKLQQESREGKSKQAPVSTAPAPVEGALTPAAAPVKASSQAKQPREDAPMLFDAGFKRAETPLEPPLPFPQPAFEGERYDAVKTLAVHLLELREMLKPKPASAASENL